MSKDYTKRRTYCLKCETVYAIGNDGLICPECGHRPTKEEINSVKPFKDSKKMFFINAVASIGK